MKSRWFLEDRQVGELQRRRIATNLKTNAKNNENYVIRLKMPRDLDIRFEDEIRGWVVVNSNNIDDKVLFKSDGMPTYHLANIVDDYLMKITHVIRGEEWLPSAPLHMFLYDCFNWEAPSFAHLPLILHSKGRMWKGLGSQAYSSNIDSFFLPAGVEELLLGQTIQTKDYGNDVPSP